MIFINNIAEVVWNSFFNWPNAFIVFFFTIVVVLQSSLYSCSFACLNGGYCGRTDAGTITCICPRGYTGSDCSEIVPCYNNSDCKNSKMCKLYYGNRYCDCENEFTGFDCSTDISRGNVVSLFYKIILKNIVYRW